jgi:hypothetical protein
VASPHTTSQPAFLVFPNLSPEYTWRVIAVETGRTIARFKHLPNAYHKAEELNARSHRRPTPDSPMPDPVFATREDFLLSDVRGTCQSWYDFSSSDPGNGYECNRPASVTDVETGTSHCVRCYRENAL